MRLVKWLVGIALAPAALAALIAAARMMGEAAAQARVTLPFLLGFAAYPLVHFGVYRPVRLYVLGHELSHALAAWMSGARVLGMFVGAKGGHVDLSRSNAWIALAPYVVPFYAVLTVFGYRLFLWWAPLRGGAPLEWQGAVHGAFLLLMGAAMAFHLVQTAETLWERRQPDLDLAGGAVFSLPCIALLNALALMAALKCLFPRAVSLSAALGAACSLSIRFWTASFRLLEAAYLAAVHD